MCSLLPEEFLTSHWQLPECRSWNGLVFEMKLGSHQRPKNLPALGQKAQNSAPYLGVPELFWKFGLDPSMLNCILILREMIPQTVSFQSSPKPAWRLHDLHLLRLSQWPFAVPFANLHLISGWSRTRQNWTQIESKILSEKVEGGGGRGEKFFQPLVFNHLFFHPTSVLALQRCLCDITAGKAREWSSCLQV